MAQQHLETATFEAFRERSDTLDQAAEAVRCREWLEALPLDRSLIAALVEPIAAIEAGLLRADGPARNRAASSVR